jgi:hypothetical protein
MDDSVLRSLAKWPNVPAVHGWLGLDRRGNFLLRVPGTERFERIGNPAFREFIGRNYAGDAEGRWYFQNGPQRVFVRLAYTPLVVHFEGDGLVDHCGRSFGPAHATYMDDEGSVLIEAGRQIALLDDRDLERYIDKADSLLPISRADIPRRFAFVPDPKVPGYDPLGIGPAK